jgi:hypothetical protein
MTLSTLITRVLNTLFWQPQEMPNDAKANAFDLKGHALWTIQ